MRASAFPGHAIWDPGFEIHNTSSTQMEKSVMNIKGKHSQGSEKSQTVGVYLILSRILLFIYKCMSASISTATELEVEFLLIKVYWTVGNIYPLGRNSSHILFNL